MRAHIIFNLLLDIYDREPSFFDRHPAWGMALFILCLIAITWAMLRSSLISYTNNKKINRIRINTTIHKMDDVTIDESKNRMEIGDMGITIHRVDIKTEDDLKNKKKEEEKNHFEKYEDYCCSLFSGKPE